MHDFFYQNNILYSDIINTDVILFPLLKDKEKNITFIQKIIFTKIGTKKILMKK